MRQGTADVGQRDSEVSSSVLALLRQQERRALFVTELSAALRKGHGVSTSDLERVLATLTADWTVVIRDHYCADPHLEGADLRVVALVEPSASADPQMQALRAIEATWHEWLAEYMAHHRCS